ncbi:16091_t:CDS:2 [Acaulospora morrowiae]|uniref:16091_t:CDS:1 n=1 Tax=Acaulospora morrowiae TaxID=94023 RepID=A0A9N9AQ47_9GLOM|nr:16091_t:CDS:2 [Acaulospora morrowiae]
MTAETEILTKIFWEIYGYRGCYRRQENFNDLYSCLLVNRSWCKTAVPILWSSVFYPIQTSRLGFITTYLSCLSPEKLRGIADSGIKLPPSLSKHLLSPISILSDRDQDGGASVVGSVKTPMFDYPSYLEELDFDKLLKSIFDWCRKHRDIPRYQSSSLSSSISSSMSSSLFSSRSVSTLASSVSSSSSNNPLSKSQYPSLHSRKSEHIIRAECILRALLQLFTSRCSNIRCFSMNSVSNYLLHNDYFENLTKIDFNGLLCEQDIRGLFDNVKECRLEWDAMAVDGFLDAFGTSCRNLEILNANFAHDPDLATLFINKKQATDLAILITTQTSLKSFVLQDHQYFTHFFLQSLNTQISTLTKLEFYSVDFKSCHSFDVIAKCGQLELLVFKDCINITVEMATPLFNAKLPKLKYVHITNSHDDHYSRASRATSEYSSSASSSSSSRSSSRSSSLSRCSSDSLSSSRYLNDQDSETDSRYISLLSIVHHRPSLSSTNHRLQQQQSDPDFCTVCPELIRWAHRRNNPRLWWSLSWWRKQLTFQAFSEFDYMDFFTDCGFLIWWEDGSSSGWAAGWELR